MAAQWGAIRKGASCAGGNGLIVARLAGDDNAHARVSTFWGKNERCNWPSAFYTSECCSSCRTFQPSNARLKDAIKAATGTQTDEETEAHRLRLLADFTDVRDKVSSEIAEPYLHYASRINVVGAYQSILGTVFKDVPGLQGYGDRNAIWVITPAEQLAFKLKNFFDESTNCRGQRSPCSKP